MSTALRTFSIHKPTGSAQLSIDNWDTLPTGKYAIVPFDASAPAVTPNIVLDFKMATDLLAMFGGEPGTVALIPGDGHSGKGLYAYYDEMIEEGAEFLGVPDGEAAPGATATLRAAADVLVRLQPYALASKAAAPAYTDSTPELHVSFSSFEDWYQAHPKATTGDKQLARDAYAAGMGDPLVVARPAPAAVAAEPVALLREMRDWYRTHGALHYVPLLEKVDALLAAAPSAAPASGDARQERPHALGCTVSVDVSTGDHDAAHRIFAKVGGMQIESDGSWTLLADETSRNFAAPAAAPSSEGNAA